MNFVSLWKQLVYQNNKTADDSSLAYTIIADALFCFDWGRTIDGKLSIEEGATTSYCTQVTHMYWKYSKLCWNFNSCGYSFVMNGMPVYLG